MRNKILVVGSLNMDLVVTVPDMPKVGETIMGTSFKTIPGGKGANQAFAASKLGGNVCMLGTVGSDAYGEVLINNLKDVGTNVESIEKHKNINSGLALICVNNNGDNNIVVVPGANELCSIEYIGKHKQLVEQCDMIVLQLEIPLETVAYVLDLAKQFEKFVILNPAPAPENLPEKLFDKIDIITPNETELQKLTHHDTDSIKDIIEAANILVTKGIETVIVTCGDKGAVKVDKNGHSHYPVEKVEVVDTTAAGDSFTAAIAVALSENKSLDQAMQFANKVASIVVTKEGAQTSIPSRNEMEN